MLLASTLVCLAASGCATRLLHRGGPATSAVPVAADQASARPAKPRHEKQQEKQKIEKPRAAKAHGERGPDVPSDPLGEARVRAQQEPSEPWWPYRAAQLEEGAGRAQAAESWLRASIARDSAYAPALTQLSRLLYTQGRHAEAVQLLSSVRDQRVSLNAAERSAVLSGLALHEAALGHDAEARTALQSLAHDERDDAVGVAAYLAVRGGSADSAEKLTAAAVKAAPESAANHNNRGIALLRAADPDGAQREFERAIALDPSRPGPYYNLAILERWYRLDTVAASKRFQEYWKHSHADPDSLYAELGRGTPTPVAEEGNPK